MSTKYVEDKSRTMLATEWHGAEDVRVVSRPAPDITDPGDAVVRVTSATVCGSDLHMYYNVLPVPRGVGMQTGDILGHESMGIIDKVGPDVKHMKVGDRVVISAPIACGTCEYCLEERYSLCDTTNPAKTTEYLYGHRTSAIFGYSSLTGGVAGGQAEYCRVPFADVNLLKVPDNLSDEQVLLLSDVICTGYHGTELAEVKPGSTVVVWGCGPVGLAAAYLSKMRGASMVISVDNQPERLAKAAMFGADTINFDQCNVTEEIAKRIPGGPSACIDCVGFRFPKGMIQTAMYKTGLATDAIDVVKEMIFVGKKGARLALIGDYFNVANGFPIGAFMEKSQNMSGGQLYCQKYWKHLLTLISSNTIDLTWEFSHRFHLNQIPQAYKLFANHEDNCTKVFIKTDAGIQWEKEHPNSYSTGNESFGKLKGKNRLPPTQAKVPIHLIKTTQPAEGGNAQVNDRAGQTGINYSVHAQGGTSSNMGTSVAGTK